MKQIRTVFITSILTMIAFGSVIYTSCRKDRCKNMVCQHGGTCNDGYCLCPQGYTGTYCQTPNVSQITFKNNTFTPVTITIETTEYTIDTGDDITFTGSHGDTLRGTGTTHGTYGENVNITPFSLIFPVRGILEHDLDVAPEYFFLKAQLNNPTVDNITKVFVNYKYVEDSTLDITVIDNDGSTYFIGYYHALDSSTVRLERTPLKWEFTNLALPKTENQSFTAVIN